MSRFYLSPSLWESAESLASNWALTGDEAKHCTRVLRHKAGDTCIIFNGQGASKEARMTYIASNSHVDLEILSSHKTPPTYPQLTLCQSIPKGSNMEWIIQKAVELGVHAIQPLITERTIARCDTKDALIKQEKWQRIALEACKQCGQNWLPRVELPLTMAQWAKQIPENTDFPVFRLIASLTPQAHPLRPILENARTLSVSHAAYLVGPEGDFTPEETALSLNTLGFTPVSLGDLVLRVETATFMGLSALHYSLGN